MSTGGSGLFGGSMGQPAPSSFTNVSGSLAGTTAGSITYYEPIQQPGYKVFIAYLNGYQNNTGVAQTITFPQSFTNSPAIITDGTGGSTVNATTLTLPTGMGAPVTGWIYIVGF